MSELGEFEKAAPIDRKKVLGSIADLLKRNGLDVEDVGRVHKVNVWQGYIKKPVPCENCHATGKVPTGLDDDGQEVTCPVCAGAKRDFIPETVDMTGIQLSPIWEEGPKWPVVQPAKPVIIRASKLNVVKRAEGFGVAMTLPDIQMGFYVDGRGRMHPTHDEAALDCALQLIRLVRPDHIVLHGDNGDFPELGKYRLTPTFVRTTQATIDRLGLLAAQVRASAGDECKIEWLEGNHEVRLPNYIIDNAKAAFGLRQANKPESFPVLTVPSLCDLAGHGVDYLPGYPANEAWINDRLRVIHGHNVVSNGSTAHKYLAQERVSTVFGHVHRREWAERTRMTRKGPRTIIAVSPGCLCRTDGAVPSTKSGWDENGVPISSSEDWQQGLAVFTYEKGDDYKIWPELVPILNGQTMWRDHLITGHDGS